MSTPLARAVENYQKQQKSRFHTPGHGGVSDDFFGDILRYDLTELPGLDSLYESSEAIAESERRYARLYGSAATIYSAGGSTLCLQTMLALIAKPGGKVAVNRGVHTSVVSALALLQLEPVWIWPSLDEETGLFRPVTPQQVEDATALEENLCGVLITSPDYYGQNAEIRDISAVCRAHHLPLLVDAAHGAHYAFLKGMSHPNQLGADLCCNSLHKTMPVLTGGAVLHLNDEKYVADAKERMSLFGSTSPSYLILLSMDILLPWLEQEGANQWEIMTTLLVKLRALAAKKGYLIPKGSRDPARLTLGFGGAGFTKEEFALWLDEYSIEPEYMDDYYAVFIPSVRSSPKDWMRLERMLEDTKGKPSRAVTSNGMPQLAQGMSVRQAVFSQREVVFVKNSVGRVAGAVVSPCPPGIPLVIPGEQITKATADLLEKNGIFQVTVVY